MMKKYICFVMLLFQFHILKTYLIQNKLNKLIGKNLYKKKTILKRLLPWDNSLKKIESQYGGAYLSLFEFVRWMFLFDLFIALIALVFIVAPQFSYKHKSDENSTCTSFSQINNQTNSTECCPFYYTEYLNNSVNNFTITDVILDVIKGKVEK